MLVMLHIEDVMMVAVMAVSEEESISPPCEDTEEAHLCTLVHILSTCLDRIEWIPFFHIPESLGGVVMHLQCHLKTEVFEFVSQKR